METCHGSYSFIIFVGGGGGGVEIGFLLFELCYSTA